MKLSFRSFDLTFKHPFTVSGFSRTTTPIVLLELEQDGIIGYGEATMPPYLGETQESVSAFLRQIDLSKFTSPLETEKILTAVDAIAPGNNAAKAGFDIALYDLVGKLTDQSVSELFSIESSSPLSSFTIGIDTPDNMVRKVDEAHEFGFRVLKIKLGSSDDREIMRRILEVWDGPFSIDANQGWTDREWALEFVHELKEHGAAFIEQPFPKDDFASSGWLTERSPLPIIADESIKRFSDLQKAADHFHGINVKLMKSTGLFEAHRMIRQARTLGLKVVTGCMAESSCAVTAMAHLAPLADWVDLDGPFLITNDPFEGIRLQEGRIVLPDLPGIGVRPQQNS